MLTTLKYILIFVGGLALLLGIAAIVLIQNTIRLSIFSRRREIEVMKLVGATNSFVRLPFMLEGMLTGLLGALGAVVMLGVVYIALNGYNDGLTDPVRLVGIPQLMGASGRLRPDPGRRRIGPHAAPLPARLGTSASDVP